MPDTALIQRAAREAADAVRERERVARRRLWLAVVILTFVQLITMSAQIYTVSQRTEEIRRVDLLAEQSRAQLLALACQLELRTLVILRGVRTMAEQFGATIPRIPGENRSVCPEETRIEEGDDATDDP